MMAFNIVFSRLRGTFRQTHRAALPLRAGGIRLALEHLEDRTAMSTVIPTIQVATNSNGSNVLFAINNNDPEDVQYWTQNNNGGWGAYTDLGEAVPLLGSPSVRQIVVGQNQSGSLEVFALISNGTVMSDTQNSNGVFQGWGAINGTIPVKGDSGGPSSMVVARNSANAANPGCLELFVVNRNDTTVYSNSQTTAGGSWGGFGVVAQVSGSTGVAVSQIAVGQNTTDGTLVLAISANDRQTYTTQQSTAGGPWIPLTPQGQAAGSTTIDQLAIGTNNSGALEIFALAGGNVYSNSQQQAGGNWGGWGQILSGTSISQITVGLNGDGTLEIFALGSGNTVYTARQLTPGGGWGSGTFTAVSNTGKPNDTLNCIALGTNQDGTFSVYARVGQTFWSDTQFSDGTWASAWNEVSQIGL